MLNKMPFFSYLNQCSTQRAHSFIHSLALQAAQLILLALLVELTLVKSNPHSVRLDSLGL
jgi:hypothetical protein